MLFTCPYGSVLKIEGFIYSKKKGKKKRPARRLKEKTANKQVAV
jgi:hypothetical protein